MWAEIKRMVSPKNPSNFQEIKIKVRIFLWYHLSNYATWTRLNTNPNICELFLYEPANSILPILTYMHNSRYVGLSIGFQTFFVLAFKIVVDSWKLTVIDIHFMR